MKNTAIASAKVIDLHAHIVIPETIGAAGAYGPVIGQNADGSPFFQIGKTYRLNGVRYVGSPFMDPDIRIQRMDERGIDFQVVSPNPLTYMHFIPAEDAVRFCRIHNDALARIVGDRSSRLAGLAAIPLQDPVAAAAELRRAVTELGLVGAGFGTDAPLSLDDPRSTCCMRKPCAWMCRCPSTRGPPASTARPAIPRSSVSNSTSLPVSRPRKRSPLRH